MKTVFEHIEYVKGKPHHVREKIAFAAATGCTVLIAFVWLAGSLWTGAFALKSSSFAESAGQSPPPATTYDSEKSGLAGAAAALSADLNTPAHIEIVDTASSTPEKKAEPTIIPF
jgi:hypothetical protein